MIYFGNIKRSSVLDVHFGWLPKVSVTDNTNETQRSTMLDNRALSTNKLLSQELK